MLSDFSIEFFWHGGVLNLSSRGRSLSSTAVLASTGLATVRPSSLPLAEVVEKLSWSKRRHRRSPSPDSEFTFTMILAVMSMTIFVAESICPKESDYGQPTGFTIGVSDSPFLILPPRGSLNTFEGSLDCIIDRTQKNRKEYASSREQLICRAKTSWL